MHDEIRFASRVFRVAAVYGFIVLAPLYLAPVPDPWRLTHFGFIGLALVFQGMFWIIAGDPLRYRALVPVAIWEKLCFGIPAVAFWLAGKAHVLHLAFGVVDLVWAALFAIVMRKLDKST